jgi:hypothetical protein
MKRKKTALIILILLLIAIVFYVYFEPNSPESTAVKHSPSTPVAAIEKEGQKDSSSKASSKDTAELVSLHINIIETSLINEIDVVEESEEKTKKEKEEMNVQETEI